MKILNLLLAFTMLFTLIPMTIFAAPTIIASKAHAIESVAETTEAKRNLQDQRTALQIADVRFPVTIDVNRDVVNIIAYLNITGDAADFTISGTEITYRQAVIDGIIYNWGGDKDGLYVNIIVIDVTDNPIMRAGQRRLEIVIQEGTGISRLLNHLWWSQRMPGTILLFQGDYRSRAFGVAHRYNLYEFKRVAAHEFGHALGICDDPREELVTIMGSRMWNTKATRLDLEMAIRASHNGQWQTFQRNQHLIRSFGILWRDIL